MKDPASFLTFLLQCFKMKPLYLGKASIAAKMRNRPDICAARETDPGDISSEMLIEPLRARGVDAVLTPTFDDAEAYLRAHWQPGDLMISHGCGDIDLLNEQIANHGNTVR